MIGKSSLKFVGASLLLLLSISESTILRGVSKPDGQLDTVVDSEAPEGFDEVRTSCLVISDQGSMYDSSLDTFFAVIICRALIAW